MILLARQNEPGAGLILPVRGAAFAMTQWLFLTDLVSVSGVAIALVYGLGGFYALRGRLEPGPTPVR